MNFNITENMWGFFIEVDCCEVSLDKHVAQCLNLSLSKYLKILKNHGTYRKINNMGECEYYFNYRNQIEEVLKALEHYIIMAKITE